MKLGEFKEELKMCQSLHVIVRSSGIVVNSRTFENGEEFINEYEDGMFYDMFKNEIVDCKTYIEPVELSDGSLIHITELELKECNQYC